MITLDEAIEILKADAKTYEDLANMTILPNRRHRNTWSERANDVRWIAEWLRELKELRAKQPLKWIPVTYHELTDEEREWFGNVDYVLDCPLPDYGQEIIISRGGEVSTDVCGCDGNCCYLEGAEDWRDVDAWMPLPEPYKKESE